MFKVEFYTLANGKSPPYEFYLASNLALRKKILKAIKYLEEFGLTRDNPDLRKISGTPLWEARILGKDNTRIICVAITQGKINILHIFKKKSQKTSLTDVNISVKRYKEIIVLDR